MYVVHVTIHVKPEHLATFLAASEHNHLGSVQEPGCRAWDLLQDATDPTTVYLHEVYDDEAAFAAHKQTPHYAAWNEAVADMMVAPRTSTKSTVTFPAG